MIKKLLALIFGLLCFAPITAASLNFGTVNTDVVNFGTLNNYSASPMTVMMWVKASTLTAPRRLWAKQGAVTFLICQIMGTGTGNIRCRNDRATPTTYDTSNCLGSTGTWYFIAMTFDEGASAGNIFHIYQGTPTSIVSECSYSAQIDGSGSFGDYSTNDFTAGNSGNASTQAWQGDIGSAMVVNRVLSLGEIRTLQSRFVSVSGTLVLANLGYTGLTSQTDWSGQKNTGTISGAKASPVNPPIGFPFLFQ